MRKWAPQLSERPRGQVMGSDPGQGADMLQKWHLVAGAILAILALSAGCSRQAAAESRVRSVEARIDGITCPTCVPPLTAALKRQYDKSTIDVDDDKDTATVHFAAGDSFS